MVHKSAVGSDFTYSSLNSPTSIRLLFVEGRASTTKLHSGGLIRISLHEFELPSAPEYIALSYTWNEETSMEWNFWKIMLLFLSVAPFYAKRIWELYVGSRSTMLNPGEEILDIPLDKFDKYRRYLGWGSSSKGKPELRSIICNGRVLRVTNNLYHALRELPRQKRKLWWIDAICINQMDDIEKGAQVNMMGRIYSQAEEVVVWLGKCTPFTKKGPRFMSSLPSLEASVSVGDRKSRQKLMRELSWRRSDNSMKIPYLSKWLAILLVINRHWFRRVWVLQEVLLAKKVVFYLGKYEFTKEDLINSVDWLNWLQSHHAILRDVLSDSLAQTASMRFIHTLKHQHQFHEKSGWQLEEYVSIVRGRESTDGRDMVFAGASLLNPMTDFSSTSGVLKADYTRNLREVYQQFTEAMITGNVGLSVLSLVSNNTLERRSNFPSWVVDLSKGWDLAPLASLGDASFDAYSLSDHTTQFAVSKGILQLNAVIWDRVTMIGDHPDSLVVPILPGVGERPDATLQMLLSLDKWYPPTGELTMTAFWRTLLLNFFHDTYPAPVDVTPSFTRWYLLLLIVRLQLYNDLKDSPRLRLQYAGQGEHNPTETAKRMGRLVEAMVTRHDSPEYPLPQIFKSEFLGAQTTVEQEAAFAAAESFGGALSKTRINRRLFCTEKGFIGAAPVSVCEGDVIMLVPGTNVPYVFRKAEPTPAASVEEFGSSTESKSTDAIDQPGRTRPGSEYCSPERKVPRRRSLSELVRDFNLRKDIRSQPINLPNSSRNLGATIDKQRVDLDPLWSEINSKPTKPLEVGGECWRLVGEAYVHGIMHGKAARDSTLQTDLIDII